MKIFENRDRGIQRQIPVWGHFFFYVSCIKSFRTIWVQNAMQK